VSGEWKENKWNDADAEILQTIQQQQEEEEKEAKVSDPKTRSEQLGQQDFSATILSEMTEQGGLLSLVVINACPRQAQEAQKLPLLLKHAQ
jgi:hypothetical protein